MPWRIMLTQLRRRTVAGGLRAAFACLALLLVQVATAADYRVFVTNERSGDLTVIDGRTDQVLQTVPLGKRPRGLGVAPDGKRLYVALSGSPIAGPGVDENSLPPPDSAADGIGVVDLGTMQLVETWRGIPDPEQLAVSADGRRLYVASESAGELVIFDTRDGHRVVSIPVGAEPEGVARSKHDDVVYVTSEAGNQLVVVSAKDNKVLHRIAVGARPRAIALAEGQSRAYVSCENDGAIDVVDTRRHAVAAHVILPQKTMRPMGLVLNPDATTLYVSTGRGGQVVAIDTRSLEVLDSIAVGARPWGIALSPDGRRLYTANGPSNDATIIDTGTFASLKHVATGTGPWGVAVQQTAVKATP